MELRQILDVLAALESLRSACELGKVRRRRRARGVVKFRSVEEADAARTARESAAP